MHTLCKPFCFQAKLILFRIRHSVCRVQAAINGEVIGDFDSYAGSRFNALGIQGVGVHTLTLKHVGVADSRWISLAEVGYVHIDLLQGGICAKLSKEFGGFHIYRSCH